jgi:hypothetical protein
MKTVDYPIKMLMMSVEMHWGVENYHPIQVLMSMKDQM